MKKKLLILLLSGSLTLSCVGCGKTYQEATNQTSNQQEEKDYFTVLTEWSPINNDCLITYCQIVYANDTKVKYLICHGCYKYGITPLYNTDGSLQVYDGE